MAGWGPASWEESGGFETDHQEPCMLDVNHAPSQGHFGGLLDRHADNREVLIRFRGWRPCQTCRLRKDDMKAVGVRSRVRRKTSNQSARVAGVACLLSQLARCCCKGISIAGIHDTARQLERVAAEPVPVLTHQNDVTVGIERNDMHPIRILEDIERCHLHARGRYAVIRAESDPAITKDIPRSIDGPGHVNSS